MAERKEVLKEKRQQYYHQAEGLLEKELFPKLDPVTADKIKEDIKKNSKDRSNPKKNRK